MDTTFWLIVLIVCIIVEGVTQGIVSIWFAIGAGAAFGALGIINFSHVVVEHNRFARADLGADAAADTACLTRVFNLNAPCERRALNAVGRVRGNKLNQVVRARLEAFTAGDTQIFVNNRFAVDNPYCIVVADLYAGTEAEAAVLARVGA